MMWFLLDQILLAIFLDITDLQYKACLCAGINISGIDIEVTPGQWEFQVGPFVGISVGGQVLLDTHSSESLKSQECFFLSIPNPFRLTGMVRVLTLTTAPSPWGNDGGFEVIKKAI